MILTEFIVAAQSKSAPGLFHLIYATGQRPGLEGATAAIKEAMRRAGVEDVDRAVVFDRTYPGWTALRKAVSGESITLNGLAIDDPVFSAHLTQHPDFRL